MRRVTVEQALEQAAWHRQQGRREVAEAICRQILGQHAGHVQAQFLLGAVLADSGRLDEAGVLLRDLDTRQPGDAGVSLTLASILRRQGDVDEAASVLQRALQQFPDDAAVCQGLGLVERARGDLSAAIGWLQLAVHKRPDFVEGRNNLGLTLTEAGQPEAAIEHFRVALRSAPSVAELHYNLGIALAALGRHADAAQTYRRATELNPGYVDAFINLGTALKTMGQLDHAIAALAQAIRLQPSRAVSHSHLAAVYEWQARHDEAVASHRRAISLAPDDAAIHGSFLYTLLFHPAYDVQALRAAHDAWAQRHSQALAPMAGRFENDRAADRRLRIGYVCGSFRDHVLGRYLMPLLREHDRAGFEIACYSNNRGDDHVTADFRRLADIWRDIGRLSDVDAASLIARDQVDILVDTTLHMEGNRLLVFARRPAPLQATIGGYPGSTGLAAIDYRFTDVHLDPPGADDDAYVEQSLRLPATFWCYDPLDEEHAVGPLPADSEGRITFGCLNNFSKVNDEVLSLWARALHAVEGSRLIMLCHEGSHRRHTLDALKRLGIEPGRIEFFGDRPRSDYLELFQRVDISLDTIPYNGHTTSLDSLWMGVPVVTLVGKTVVGRAGLSQLTNLGLPDLIAFSPEQYVSIAAALAADHSRLRELRRSLRSLMENSPLMDAKRFARDVEAAYRRIWQRWCGQDSGGC